MRKTPDNTLDMINPHISHFERMNIKIDKNNALEINDK